jgi:hypothetical protein
MRDRFDDAGRPTRHAGRVNMPRLVSSAVAVTVVSVSGTACASESPEVAPEPTTFSAHGRVIMEFGYGDAGSGMDAYCNEKFSEVSGRQISVKDPSGKVVAFGVLSDATADLTQGICVATWDTTDIAETTDVLSYQIGQYEPVLFKQAEADSLAIRVPDKGEGYQVGVG